MPALHAHWVPRASPPDLAPAQPPRRCCQVVDRSGLLVPYSEAWQQQREAVRAVEASAGSGVLLLQQHPPVYTLGAGSSLGHLRFDPARPPHPLHRTERGGEVTYHGPGQLVLYPVVNLRHFRQDLHWFLRSLEEVVIRSLQAVSGLEGQRLEGLTGVWVGGRKVAALGVRATRWVTYHGLALNVAMDLAPFGHIVPCGISDRGVTSVEELLASRAAAAVRRGTGAETAESHNMPEGCGGQGLPAAETGRRRRELLLQEYACALLECFSEVFDCELEQVDMGAALKAPP